jgi:hypothetical protein
MFKSYGLNPIADREEFVRLYPVFSRYAVYTLPDARRTYKWLKRHDPEELRPVEEPGTWRWNLRDRRGRWTTLRDSGN